MNDGWKFSEVYEEGMCYPAYDESQMTNVRLPHTCKELPFHYFDEEMYQMVSGYRKGLRRRKIGQAGGLSSHLREWPMNVKFS